MRRYSRAIARWFGVEFERGVSAIEYALLAAGLVAVIAAAASALSGGLISAFTAIGTKITTAVGT